MPLLASMRRAGASSSAKASSFLSSALSSGRATMSKAASSGSSSLWSFGKSIMLGSGEAFTQGLSVGARRQLVWWLGGSAALVYGVVVLAGTARVTRCVLSLTELRLAGLPLGGVSQERWQALYEQYRSSPQFERATRRASLEELKNVVGMEQALKVMRWALGLAFVVPGAYFLNRGWVNAALAKRLGLLLFMGATHLLAGSFVLGDGIKKPDHDWDTPHVRPYRPGFHLISAGAMYSVLLWTALDVAFPKQLLATASTAVREASGAVRSRALLYAATVAFTAMTGAFVAGKDAGRAYNTYPDMDGRIVPPEYWDMSLRPLWRNTFENTAANQFHHRMMAATTAIATLAFWPWVRASAAPQAVKWAMDGVLGVNVAQMALGIWTLVQKVPVTLGTLHQANSLHSLTAVLVLLHTLRPMHPGPMSHALATWGTPLAAAAVGIVGWAVSTQP